VRHTIQAVIRRGEQSGYVAECAELSAVTQGSSLDEAAKNLREAIDLALEGENLAELGLASAPVIVVTFELETAVA
jgi:predicted RNase H-like HicB family nuclease